MRNKSIISHFDYSSTELDVHMDNDYERTIVLQNELIKEFRENSIDTVYHYTSSTGLESILKNRMLRFADYRYLNDIDELEYGRKLILNCIRKCKSIYKSPFLHDIESYYDKENCISERKEHFVYFGQENKPSIQLNKLYRIYIFCCSLDPDNLEMWNYYNKETSSLGYRLSLSVSELLEEIEKAFIPFNGVNLYSRFIYEHRVIYQINQQEQLINKALEIFRTLWSTKIIEDESLKMIVFILDLYAIYMKDEVFSNEKEYRFSFYIPTESDIFSNKKSIELLQHNQEINSAKFNLSSIQGSFVPKIDIPISKLENIISQIIIGPYKRQDFSIDGLKELLLYYGFEELASRGDGVDKSNIKIRY